MCGERAAISDAIYNEWKMDLRELLKKYESWKVFKANETALFFISVVYAK